MYDRVYMCSCILHVRMYTYLSYIYPFHTETRNSRKEVNTHKHIYASPNTHPSIQTNSSYPIALRQNNNSQCDETNVSYRQCDTYVYTCEYRSRNPPPKHPIITIQRQQIHTIASFKHTKPRLASILNHSPRKLQKIFNPS